MKTPPVEIMVDLETLGTCPGAAFLAIGAVKFNPITGLITDSFYINIDVGSCLYHGMTVDPETLKWWQQQKEAARLAAFMPDTPPVKLGSALMAFKDFCRGLSMSDDPLNNVRIWGNGADFDNALLAKAYELVNGPRSHPWHFWNSRCFRTVKTMFSAKFNRGKGTHHNALDDATAQALHLMKLPVPAELWK